MAMMFRRVSVSIAAVVLLVVGAAGCGFSSTSTSSSGDVAEAQAEATTTTKAPPSMADLSTALLTLNDLPAGFSPIADTGGNSSDDSIVCQGARSGVFKDVSGTAGAKTGKMRTVSSSGSSDPTVEFSQSQLGPFVMESLGVVDDPKAEFDAGVEALDSCMSKPWTQTNSDGMTMTFSLAPVSFPKHGDDQAAYKLTAQASGVQIEIEGVIVLIRENGVLMVVGGFGTVSVLGDHLLDVQQFSAIVDTAVAKVAAL
jgi:ABC-type transport system substrate-binding protein